MSKAMHTTRHMQRRMGQRGVSRDLVDLVLTHGRLDRDRFVLDRKEALDVLQHLQREERLLKKIVDKGGLVVVADGAALLTTYNYESREHWGRS